MKRLLLITFTALSAILAPGFCPHAAEVPPTERTTQRAEFIPFAAWVAKYTQATSPAERDRMLPEGIQLAQARREVLVSLLKSNPRQALASSLPDRVRRALPSEISEQLEQRLSGMGDLEVLCPFPEKDHPVPQTVQRIVRMDGQTYSAYVYGRRAFEATKAGIPLRGVIVDGMIALDADVLRELGPGEVPQPGQAIDLQKLASPPGAGRPVYAEAGGKVFVFASHQQLQLAESWLEAAEGGLVGDTKNALESTLQEAFGYRLDSVAKAHPRAALNVNHPAVISVLAIRVDFSDMPGDPGRGTYTAPFVQDVLDHTIAPYYLKSSFGHVMLTNTVAPKLYHLQNPAGSYATSSYAFQLFDDAEAAAAADYNLSTYDRIIVIFPYVGGVPGSQVLWGGQAQIGGSHVWVNGEVDFRVLAHELGHTFGFNHAGAWETTDGNPVSDSGTLYEYGDLFDTMSANYGNDSRTDFNPGLKNQAGWIGGAQVQTVTASGIYRVHRIDGPAAIDVVALKIPKDRAKNYWITCRRNFTENTSMMHGAYVIWGCNWPSYTYLINTVNPGGSFRNAALPVDRTLIDPEANITISPVAEGGESPNEYLDVQVTFGPPPIIVSQSSPQDVVAGQGANFSVQASGTSPVSYQWECKPNGSAAWVPLTDDNTYSGSHSASLVVSADNTGMNGDQFRCILTNPSGGFNSTQPQTLSVLNTGVSTLAGQPGVSGDANGLGNMSQFHSPAGVVADANGTIWVADSENGLLRKVTITGQVSTFTGPEEMLRRADHAGQAPRFKAPAALALDRAGNLYVVDQGNATILQVTPEGTVRTLAGSPEVPALADGQGAAAGFNLPSGIAVDAATNIYVADTGSHTIRRISLDGTVVTYAGVTGVPGNGDGFARHAPFRSPTGVACDRHGNVFVTDTGNNTIRKITPKGQVITIAGLAGSSGKEDGIGSAVRFNAPAGIAMDDAGDLYVTDQMNSTIRRIAPGGSVTPIAGAAGPGSADGTLGAAQFLHPVGITMAAQGLLCVADTGNDTLRLVRVATIASPSLQVTDGPNGTTLFWPVADGNAIVEASSQFDGAPWATVTNQVNISGDYYVLTLTPDASQVFFRLRR